MATVALRPGLLVSLSTRMSGGVEYQRVDLDKGSESDGARVERWETTKVVTDPAEHERASKVRSKCSSLIRAVCTRSAFGLLCLASQEEALDKAVAEARKLARDFNEEASTVQVGVYVLKGRIADSDREAARAILSEMRELIDNMRKGIRTGDVTAIREAASQAKKIASMVDEETAQKFNAAVTEARDVAKTIVKKLVEDAPSVPEYVTSIKFDALDESRFAFLDDSDEVKVQASAQEMPQLEYDA